jgi:hypothetical protein
LEALTQVAVDQTPVLLVAYDVGYPEPLRGVRPIPDAFGIAMVLAPPGSEATPVITATLTDDPAQQMAAREFESMRVAIPAARSLPLLEKLARREPGRVVLDYLEAQRIAVEVSQWP